MLICVIIMLAEKAQILSGLLPIYQQYLYY